MGEQTRDERLALLRTRQEQRTQRLHPAKHARRIAGSVAGVGFVAMVPMMGPLRAAETSDAGVAIQPSPTIPPRVVPVASVVTVIPTVVPGTTSPPALLPTSQQTSMTAITVIPKDRVEPGINSTTITTATSAPDLPTVPEGVMHPVPTEQRVVAQPLVPVGTAPPESAPAATTPTETTQPVAAPVSTEPPPLPPPSTLPPPPPVTEPPPPTVPPPPPTSGASGG
jgi:hypothetical protein